jgi:hypothetical protein
MQGRIALLKHFRAKATREPFLCREAFEVRTRPRVAFSSCATR